MIHQRRTFFVLTLVIIGLFSRHSKAQEIQGSCPKSPENTSIVKTISKNNIISLANGSELVLANIYQNQKNAHQFLKKKLLNEKISYISSGRIKDRYNRFIVQIFYQDNNETKWLQKTLIESGYAVAVAYPTNWQCMDELLEIENASRKDDSENQTINFNFPIVRAENIKSLNKNPQGSFHIVKGKVRSISRTSQNTYINFSHNWRKDFTAVVSNYLLKQKKRPWPKLKLLKGKNIIVRGWLDHYNGPLIRLETPEMIEIKN